MNEGKRRQIQVVDVEQGRRIVDDGTTAVAKDEART